MDQSKEMFKIIYLIYFLTKGDLPMNGQGYLKQVMRRTNLVEFNIDDDAVFEAIIQDIGEAAIQRMFRNFLNNACDFDLMRQFSRQQSSKGLSPEFTRRIYVCCIMYHMGLPIQERRFSRSPSISEVCHLVQIAIPSIESDADSALQLLKYPFLAFEQNYATSVKNNVTNKCKTMARHINKPPYISKKKSKEEKEVKGSKKAKLIEESNSGKIYESAVMLDEIDEVESFVEITQNRFGTNGVATMKIRKVPKVFNGSVPHFNVSTKSTGPTELIEVPYKDEVTIEKIFLRIWTKKRGQPPKLRFDMPRCSRWF